MAGMWRGTAMLLALQATVAEAQRPTIVLPADLTPAQRQELISRCKERWQDWCSQLGMRRPQPIGTSDGAPQQPDPRQQCYVTWQPYCRRYNIPNPAQSQPAESTGQDVKKAIEQCRREWRPGCDRLGVPKPDQGSVSIWLPSPPLPPPQPVGPSAFECEVGWSERCGNEFQAVRSLLEHGPSGVAFPDPLQFTATGFIRAGWPIVVKYQIPPGAIATLTVKPEYGRGKRVRLKLPGSVDGSPQSYAFVPQVEDSDGGLMVADYKITARYFVKGARDPVAPVQVLGFGAGNRAAVSRSYGASAMQLNAAYPLGHGGMRSALPVISAMYAAQDDSQPIAINDVDFRPPIIDRPIDDATIALTYSYVLTNEWDRVAEDLWHSCNAVLRCDLYRPRAPYAPTVQGPQRWRWLVDRGTPTGLYQLVVRAWRTCGAVVDPDSYLQCGDSADWVIGSAGPLSVRGR